MTSGTRVTGAVSSPIYRYKSWSGGNDPVNRAQPNDYDCVIKEHDYELSKVYDLQGSFITQGYFSCNGTNAPPFDAYQEAQLSQKFLEAVRGHDFDLGVFAAEGKQSLEQIKRTAAAIASMVINLRHGRLGNAARAVGVVLGQRQVKQIGRKLNTGDLSGAVLALRYGWLPLIQDCFAAAQSLEVIVKRRQVRFTASKSVFSEWIDSMNGTAPVKARGHRTVKLTLYMTEEPSTYTQLGLTNPASVVWELMPWSFVLDWFIPIGNYLSAASFFRGVQGTYVRSEFARAAGAMYTIPQPYKQVRVGGVVTYKAVSLKRSVTSSYTPPRPAFKPIEKALGLGHLQNAAALIHQLVFNAKRR